MCEILRSAHTSYQLVLKNVDIITNSVYEVILQYPFSQSVSMEIVCLHLTIDTWMKGVSYET